MQTIDFSLLPTTKSFWLYSVEAAVGDVFLCSEKEGSSIKNIFGKTLFKSRDKLLQISLKEDRNWICLSRSGIHSYDPDFKLRYNIAETSEKISLLDSLAVSQDKNVLKIVGDSNTIKMKGYDQWNLIRGHVVLFTEGGGKSIRFIDAENYGEKTFTIIELFENSRRFFLREKPYQFSEIARVIVRGPDYIELIEAMTSNSFLFHIQKMGELGVQLRALAMIPYKSEVVMYGYTTEIPSSVLGIEIGKSTQKIAVIKNQLLLVYNRDNQLCATIYLPGYFENSSRYSIRMDERNKKIYVGSHTQFAVFDLDGKYLHHIREPKIFSSKDPLEIIKIDQETEDLFVRTDAKYLWKVSKKKEWLIVLVIKNIFQTCLQALQSILALFKRVI